MTLDYLNSTIRMPCPGSVKLSFAHSLAVLIKLIKPTAEFHARIKISPKVH